VQDAASGAVGRLIPVELGIQSLYEDYDRRRRKRGGEKAVTPHLQVWNKYPPTHNKADALTSVDVLRIEPHSGRFAKGESGKWKS
jgi:hypothetical protein